MPIKKRQDAHGKWSYRYDFNLNKKRYVGRWGPNRGAAQRAETAKRLAVESGTDHQKTPGQSLTLKDATDRYWNDVAQHHRSADQIAYKIELLHRLLGADTPIADIRTAQISEAISARRAEPVENAMRDRGVQKRMEQAQPERIANALKQRNAALQLIADGVAPKDVSKRTGYSLSSCKKQAKNLREWIAMGKSAYEWLKHRESLSLTGYKVRSIEERYQLNKPRATSTVNRDIIDQLRPILNHVAEIHELALPRIAWKRLRLEDNIEVVTEYTSEQIEAWASHLAPVEQIFLGFALTYGPRFGEMFFPPSALQANDAKPTLTLGRYIGRRGKVFESRKAKGKERRLHKLPLLRGDASLLAALAGRAEAAGLSVIWFDEDERGDLTPISYWGMNARLKRGARKAGISMPRLIHGMRHHAGTQIMRRFKSLSAAQKLLGHRHVSTTTRYAHAADDDVRDGLTAVGADGASPLSLTYRPAMIEDAVFEESPLPEAAPGLTHKSDASGAN